MQITARAPQCLIRIDGQYEYTYPISANWSYNLKQPVAQAQIVLPGPALLPNRLATAGGSIPATYWSRVEIGLADFYLSGPIPGGGYGWVGSWQKRFDGYVTGVSRALYPNYITLNCAGRMKKAEILMNPDTHHIPWVPSTQIQGGTDLSGRTDIQQVSHCLQQSDLGYDYSLGVSGSLGGLNRILGIDADDQFGWLYGESALSYIQKIDQICLGFRTYDTPDLILRARISARPDLEHPPVATFTEGYDIERGQVDEDPASPKNYIAVTGYNDGTGVDPPYYAVRQRCIYLPGLAGYNQDSFSSGMIEYETYADVVANGSNGISCEEVARWMLDENNRLFIRAQMTTPRMDRIDVGQTIVVGSQGRMRVNRAFWVQGISCQYSASGFKQTFDCVDSLPSLGVIEDSETNYVLNLDKIFTRLTADTTATSGSDTIHVFSAAGMPVPPFSVNVENDTIETLPVSTRYPEGGETTDEAMLVTAMGGVGNKDWSVTRVTTDTSIVTTHALGKTVAFDEVDPTTIVPTTIVGDTSVKASTVDPLVGTPPGWSLSDGFDDTAWLNAVVADTDLTYAGPVVSGTSPIWQTTRPLTPHDEILFRHTFSLPTGQINTATLTIAAAYSDILEDILINNQQLLTNGYIAGDTYVLPLNLGGDFTTGSGGPLTGGVTNVIAVRVRAASVQASPNDYSWLSYKLEVA